MRFLEINHSTFINVEAIEVLKQNEGGFTEIHVRANQVITYFIQKPVNEVITALGSDVNVEIIRLT